MSVYVGNLSYDITKDDLTQLFAEYGTVKSVHIPKDRKTGQLRGFAFVEMATNQEEATAIETLNKSEFMGQKIKVNSARPRNQGTNAQKNSKKKKDISDSN